MIGSSTMIIRQGGSYCLHIFGRQLELSISLQQWKEKGVSVFKQIAPSVLKWENPDKENLTEAEVLQVADATHCISERSSEPGYSEFAGDGVYLLDLDNQTFSYRDRQKKTWIAL